MMPATQNCFTRIRQNLILVAFGLVLMTSASACEDDPIVEPSNKTQSGGSYGGRLAQPNQEPGTTGKAATDGAKKQNPAVY